MKTDTNTNAFVAEMLQKIMQMSDEQRYALRNAWDALDGVGQAGPAGQTEASLTAELDDLESWLESTRSLGPRQRVAILRQALAREDIEAFQDRINSEISSIKNQDRKFAIELAITDFAYEHPVLVVLALVGVGVALYRISKTLWSFMF